jgi:peptidoglycan hydrolase-like protein with peptidoglycan-binding domain
MSKVIRLTESDLVRLVKRVINEGRVYPDDYKKIWEMVKKEPTYNWCNLLASKVVIGKGNQGPLVALWQDFLNTEKNAEPEKYTIKEDLVVDGVFGEKTKNLTIEFQKVNGLTKQDGIVGARTARKIGVAGYNCKEQFEENCPGLKAPSNLGIDPCE